MKGFYAVVFENNNENVREVFCSEEDARQYCNYLNEGYNTDEQYKVHELNEEQVNEFWGILDF